MGTTGGVRLLNLEAEVDPALPPLRQTRKLSTYWCSWSSLRCGSCCV